MEKHFPSWGLQSESQRLSVFVKRRSLSSEHLRHVLLATVAIMVWVVDARPCNAYPKNREIVARVGDRAIYSMDLAARLKSKIASTSYHRRPSPERTAKLEKAALDELIRDNLLFLESIRRNIEVADADIDNAVDQQASRFGGKREFRKLLKQKGYSLDDFRQAIGMNVAIQNLLTKAIDARAKVGVEEARAFFDANRDRYILPISYHVKHVMVTVLPNATGAERSKAEELANGIAEELRKGSQFEELKRKHAQAKFTDFGYVHKGAIVDQMQKVVEELAVHEVGGPVKTIQGYQICLLVGKKESQKLSFDKVDESVIKERTIARRTELLEELLAACKKRWPVKIVRQIGKHP